MRSTRACAEDGHGRHIGSRDRRALRDRSPALRGAAHPGAARRAAQDRGRAGEGGAGAPCGTAHECGRTLSAIRGSDPALSRGRKGRGTRVSAEVLWRPVRDLSELVRSRKVRAVELAELYLDRLERIGPRYNAVVTVMRDHALGQARRADAEIAAGRWGGPVHGIALGVQVCVTLD